MEVTQAFHLENSILISFHFFPTLLPFYRLLSLPLPTSYNIFMSLSYQTCVPLTHFLLPIYTNSPIFKLISFIKVDHYLLISIQYLSLLNPFNTSKLSIFPCMLIPISSPSSKPYDPTSKKPCISLKFSIFQTTHTSICVNNPCCCPKFQFYHIDTTPNPNTPPTTVVNLSPPLTRIHVVISLAKVDLVVLISSFTSFPAASFEPHAIIK